jgi:hypothetical protein
MTVRSLSFAKLNTKSKALGSISPSLSSRITHLTLSIMVGMTYGEYPGELDDAFFVV